MKTGKFAAVGIVTVLMATALALTIGTPVPFLADSIAQRFETATGYRLQMAGLPTLRLLPAVSVSLSGISILDGSGPRPQTRLTADSVRIRTEFSSIFSARPHLTEIALMRPVLQVALVRDRAPPPGAAGPSAGGSAPSDGPTIDRLVVADGAVEFASQDGVEGRLEGVALDGLLAGDRVVDVKVSGRIGEQALSAHVKGKLPSGRDDAPGPPLEFTIEAPGILQGAVAGAADVRLKGSMLELNSISGTLAQASFNGWGSFDFAGKFAIKTGIGIQRLALGPAKPDSADPAAGLDQPWSDRAVDLKWLNFLDAEVQVAANELSIGRFRLAPASVGIILDNGVLTAGVTQSGAYGGQAQGLVVVNATGGVPSHTFRVDFSDVQAQPLLDDAASFNALDGRMRVRIDVRGRGESPRAIMSSLGGAVDLLVQDGEIHGISIAKMVRSVAARILTGWQKDAADKTDLTQLSVFLRLEDGRALTDNLRLLGPLVRMTGSGAADLGGKSLQLWVEPKLVPSATGQGGVGEPVGIGVPIAVQGSWVSPRIYPDIAGIQTSPDAAYAKLRELGKGLFGSDPGNPVRP